MERCSSFLELCPKQLDEVGFKQGLKSDVSCDGLGIGVTHTLPLRQVAPTLPSAGISASIPSIDLAQGVTGTALLVPSLDRILEEKVTRPWALPRVRVAPDDLRLLFTLLYDLGFLCVVDATRMHGNCRMGLWSQADCLAWRSII